jgi:hypothetical protein
VNADGEIIALNVYEGIGESVRYNKEDFIWLMWIGPDNITLAYPGELVATESEPLPAILEQSEPTAKFTVAYPWQDPWMFRMHDYDLRPERDVITKPLREAGLLVQKPNPKAKAMFEDILGVELHATPGGALFAQDGLITLYGHHFVPHLRTSLTWLKSVDKAAFEVKKSRLVRGRDTFIENFDITVLYSEKPTCLGIGFELHPHALGDKTTVKCVRSFDIALDRPLTGNIKCYGTNMRITG